MKTVSKFFLKKLNHNVSDIRDDINAKIDDFLQISKNVSEKIFFSSTYKKIIENAYQNALKKKAKFASIFDIFFSLATTNSSIKKYLKKLGVNEENVNDFVKIFDKTDEKIIKENEKNKLENFSKNLNMLAKEDKLDPVIARDKEIRRIIQILSRRQKNNPILIGESGVGKNCNNRRTCKKNCQQRCPREHEE